ncbi:MAG TPA: M56 family metallopeptidase [Gemmatimonadales bacterium]|nr:M56 family metallopeptidase [Gemmatimonadales bacterium]
MTSADLLSWLLTYAAHSTILLGLAWIISRRTQAPAVREVLWKTALIGALVTVSVQRAGWTSSLSRQWAMRLEMPAAHARQATSSETTPSAAAGVPARPHQKTAPLARETPSVATSSLEANPAPAPLDPRPSTLDGLTGLLSVAWALVALLLVVRFLASRWRLSSSLGRRRPVTDPALNGMVAELREAAGIRRDIRLTWASGLSSPVALGYGEICLPEVVMSDLEAEQQRSVLAHELAHLARFDPLWLDAAGILERVFFFQPLNRLARDRMQDAAEYLCDDWAVRRTGSGLTLAKCLVKVAEWMETSPRPVPVSGMAEHRSQLVSRIHRLIGNHAMRTGPRPRWLLPASAVLLLGTVAFAPGFTSRNRAAAATPEAESAWPVITVADTDSTIATPRHRQQALADLERQATRLSRTTLQSTELRAELAARGRTLSRINTDLSPALAMTIDRQARLEGLREDRIRGADTNNAAVPALLIALKDPEVAVRRAAAQSLANLEDIRTVPGLIEALKDADKEVRESAAGGLGNLKDERAIDGLILLLKDSDAGVRAAAVEALGNLESAKAIPGLTAALSDTDKDVRRQAISALSRFDHPAPVDAFILALKDADANVRQEAANALGNSEDKRAVKPLIAALSDPSPDVRQAAAEALGSLQAAESAEALAALLKDLNADVRQAGAGALGNMELTVAPAALIAALSDANHDVRQRAANTAGQIGDAKAVPALKLLLDDSDADVRESAVDALSDIKDRAALDALIGALKSKDPNVRKRAAEALGHREE